MSTFHKTANQLSREENMTKTRAMELARQIKAEVKRPVRALANDLYNEAMRHYEARHARRRNRWDRRVDLSDYPRLKPVYAGTPLAQRHELWTRETFKRQIRDFRTATSGDHCLNLFVTDDPNRVTAKGWSEQGEQYSRRCRYKKTDSVHEYTIPRNWISTVYMKDLERLSGLVTIKAVPVMSRDGITVYEAKWVRQGVGFSLVCEAGWIAVVDGDTAHHYHGRRSAGDTFNMLRRKTRMQLGGGRTVERMERLRQMMLRYDLGKYGGITVSLDDSYKAGNCVPGTLEFRQRVFGDTDRTSCTISEAVERIKASGQDMERLGNLQVARQFLAACLQAIRRHRAERRQAKRSEAALAV